MATFFPVPTEHQQAPLQPQEMQLRDAFVEEYLRDNDPLMAVLRLGFSKEVAQDFSHEFMFCGYVQRKIAERQQELFSQDRDQVAEQMFPFIVAGLRKEARYFGPGSAQSARVAAFSKLSSMLGIDAPTKTEVAHSGGVVMVPGIASLGEWEDIAMTSQKDTSDAVRGA